MLAFFKTGLKTRLNRREVTTLLLASCLPLRLQAQTSPNNPPTQPAPEPGLVIRSFVDHLIPEDELTPAASSLGVDRRLLAQSEADPLYRRFLAQGIAWLNRQADGDYTRLAPGRQRFVIQWMEQSDPKGFPHQLYRRLRYDAMLHYYGQRASWRGLPISQPPQPVGYPDFKP